MKTLKQMADELGVPKQRVYRFVKQEKLTEAYCEGKTMFYDEVVEKLIKSVFSKNSELYDAPDEADLNEEKLDAIDEAILETLECNEKIIETLVLNKQQIENYQNVLEEKERIITQYFSDQANMQSKKIEETEKNIIETLQDSLDRVCQQLMADLKAIESRDEQIRQLQSELAIERQHSREMTDKLVQLTDNLAQLADQAQRLQLMQMQPPMLPDSDEDEHNQKPSFWKRIFRRNE